MKKLLSILFMALFILSCDSSDDKTDDNILLPDVIEKSDEYKFYSVGDSQFAIINGKFYAWGDNTNGQLGLGDTETRLSPTHVSFGDEVRDFQYELILSGDSSYNNEKKYFFIVTTKNGDLYIWGDTSRGFFGVTAGTLTTPRLVKIENETVTDIEREITPYSYNNIIYYIYTQSGNVYLTGGNQYELAKWPFKNLKIFNSLDNFVSKPSRIPGLKGKGSKEVLSYTINYTDGYFEKETKDGYFVWNEGEDPKIIDMDGKQYLEVYKIHRVGSSTGNTKEYAIIRAYDYSNEESNTISYFGTQLYRYYYSLPTHTNKINVEGNIRDVKFGSYGCIYILTDNGNLYIYGCNSCYANFIGSNCMLNTQKTGGSTILTPTKIDLTEKINLLAGNVAISENGSFYKYGPNKSIFTINDVIRAEKIASLPVEEKVKKVFSSYILMESGNIYSFDGKKLNILNNVLIDNFYDHSLVQGKNGEVILLNPLITEIEIKNENLSKIKSVVSIDSFMYILFENGSLYRYDTEKQISTKFRDIIVKEIKFSHNNMNRLVVLDSNNKFYTSGTNNKFGILGVGDTEDRDILTEIIFP